MQAAAPAVPSVGCLPTGIRLKAHMATAAASAGVVLGRLAVLALRLGGGAPAKGMSDVWPARRSQAGRTKPGRNHAKLAHPGNDTSTVEFCIVASQFPVTIQWTTGSGTGSSAANTWISACSTTTAGYPGCPPAGPANRRVDGGCLGGRDRSTALGGQRASWAG